MKKTRQKKEKLFEITIDHICKECGQKYCDCILYFPIHPQEKEVLHVFADKSIDVKEKKI